jgi:tetratricopeptide (TPR) repeat protein
LAYHNSFHGPFIFDDVASIPENPQIRHLWPISKAMVTSPDLAVKGRPVECLTLALNYAWGGRNVWSYHAVNLMLHVASALVLFGLLRRTFEGKKLRHRLGTAAPWLAAAIALIWEVHPLQTESVTYLVQRSELLMGLFLLLTLYCTLRGSQSSCPRLWYAAAVVSCSLGMGSKEDMVGAPLIVLLYDRVFLASSFRELWRRRMSLYIGLATTWLLLAALVAGTIHPLTGFGLEILTPWNYLRTEAGVIVHYLRLCFWPCPLVIDYFDWPIARSAEDAVVPGLVVVGLLGVTVWALCHRPYTGFLAACFFLILGPTSSILPIVGEVAAERRMYLPLAAVVTLTVVAAFALGKRLLSERQGIVLGCVSGGIVVTLFAFLTIQRNQDYRSVLAIWQDAVERRPGNDRAHNNLGLALAEAGRVPEAIRQYRQALRLQPNCAEAHYNLGLALAQQGNLAEAIGQYEGALQFQPDFAEAHASLGIALMEQGRLPEAVDHYEQALRFRPDLACAHYDLGLALVQLGRLPAAMEQWEEELRLNPDYAPAHYNLGLALEKLGRAPEAAEQYEQALQVQPDFVQARNGLARARAAQ